MYFEKEQEEIRKQQRSEEGHSQGPTIGKPIDV